MDNRIKVGCIAKCKHGKLGIVTRINVAPDGKCCFGIGFDGSNWQSIDPVFIDDSVDNYKHTMVREYLDNALSYYTRKK